MHRSAAVALAASLVAVAVLAGTSAAHYPSITYYPPALGPDGGLYLAGGAGSVYALAGDGGPRWSHGVGDEVTDGPTVHRGTVVVPTADGRVVAVSPDGNRSWTAVAGDRRGRYWTTAAGDTVYAAGPGGVTALAAADGAVRWSSGVGGPVVAGPVVVDAGVVDGAGAGDAESGDDEVGTARSDARVVVGVGRGDDARLVALDAGGDVAWRLPLPDDVRALAAARGRALVAAGGAVRAVDAGGDRLWRVATGEVSGLSPAPDGAVVGTYDGAVVRVRDGRVAWRAPVEAAAVAPAPGPEGRWVYAVTPEAVVGVRDGAVRWRTRVGLTVLEPPTVGRRVHVGTQVNRTYALERDGDVAWIDRFATPVGTAPEVDHAASPPSFLAEAAGAPTRVVRRDGTARRPGGLLGPVGGAGWPDGGAGGSAVAVAALVTALVVAGAAAVALGRRWR